MLIVFEGVVAKKKSYILSSLLICATTIASVLNEFITTSTWKLGIY